MTAPLTRTPELDRREHTQPVDTAERRDANWEAIAARLDAFVALSRPAITSNRGCRFSCSSPSLKIS